MENNLESQSYLQPVDEPTKNSVAPTKSRLSESRELIDSVNQSLQSAEGCLGAINECLISVDQITSGVCSSIIEWKRIDQEMHSMDLHFAQFSKQLDSDMDRYKARIPVIEKQLDAINVNLSKILDFVLMMDAKTESEMDMKMRWMDKIDAFLNTISTTMIKML